VLLPANLLKGNFLSAFLDLMRSQLGPHHQLLNQDGAHVNRLLPLAFDTFGLLDEPKFENETYYRLNTKHSCCFAFIMNFS
jgi:hypothetical protein